MQMLRFILLAVGSDALRTSRHSATDGAELPRDSNGHMKVKNLYTFGAPMMAAPALADPLSPDGCFPGLRLVTKEERKGVHKVDIVPPCLKGSRYAHTRAEIGFLYINNDRLDRKSCGWVGHHFEGISIPLHALGLYVSQTIVKYPHLGDMAAVALASSQNSNEKQVADFVRSKGYGLIASARCTRLDEVAHLIQDPRTLDCWLTFEGSDSANDWLQNLKVFRTDFCGLEQFVHTGFKNSTMAMVLEPTFQNNLRPKLGHCRNVEVLGHSLGGAISGLFTACAHSKVQQNEKGYGEFQHIYFDKKDTKLMDFL